MSLAVEVAVSKPVPSRVGSISDTHDLFLNLRKQSYSTRAELRAEGRRTLGKEYVGVNSDVDERVGMLYPPRDGTPSVQQVWGVDVFNV